MPFNTLLFRYILDLLGLVVLFIGTVTHNMPLDALGLVLLILGLDHAALFGQLTKRVRDWASYTFAFLMEPEEEEVRRGRTPWDLADSAYFEKAQDAYLRGFPSVPTRADPPEALTSEEQLDFFDRFEKIEETIQPCAYRETPCGRPTHIRAWGDCQ